MEYSHPIDLTYLVSKSQYLHAHIFIIFKLTFDVQILHTSSCGSGDMLSGATDGECESVPGMSAHLKLWQW